MAEQQEPMPMCSGCGHHASGIVAETCSNFAVYPDGDPRGYAGYCQHRCVDDPVVREWLGPDWRPLKEILGDLLKPVHAKETP
jgi:ribosomal protein L34E